MNDQISTTKKAEGTVQRWIDWCGGLRSLPVNHVVADVVEAYASDLVPQGNWFPIASLPEGRHVLLYWPNGERGNGGIECATVYFSDHDRDDPWSYWTHGGPNSGYDWDPRDDEKPTHWMPLPEFPRGAESNAR